MREGGKKAATDNVDEEWQKSSHLKHTDFYKPYM